MTKRNQPSTSTATESTETDAAESSTETRNFGELFTDAIAGNATSDQVVDAYRALPGSSRGKQLSAAMAGAIGANPTSADAIVDLFNACNVRPVSEREPIDAAAVYAAQRDALLAVVETLRGELSASDAARVDSVAIDAELRDAIAQRVDAASRRGLTRTSRAVNGKHGEQGAQHVAAWIDANASDLPDGTFVRVGEIAGRQGDACTLDGSPYQGGKNPSVGAVGNVLTGTKNDTENTGDGWRGQTSPRGLVIVH